METNFECQSGLKFEEFHLQWELLMRHVRYQLHTLHNGSSAVSLPEFYCLKSPDFIHSLLETSAKTVTGVMAAIDEDLLHLPSKGAERE
jgi:hypothetical protein